MDLDMPLVGDGYDLPEGETSLSDAYVLSNPDSLYIEESIDTQEAAGAPLQRTRRVPKSIASDKSVELRKQVLADWMAQYSTNMQHARESNLLHKVPSQAKRNAEHWILGLGLGGVGSGIGVNHFRSPLGDFAGNSLYEMITGVKVSTKDRKRGREDDSEEESTNTERRVRHRPDETDIGRAAEMDLEGGVYFRDDDVELPREAQDTMDDLTSMMPWNISASLRGSSLPRGATNLLAPSSLTGRGTRLVSASPLANRSRPAGLDELLASDSVLAVHSRHLDTSGSIVDIGQFQTTDENSQSQSAALDRESNNFLAYVVEAIDAKQTEAEQLALQLDVDADDVTDITFDDILSPETNSKAAAAQGLMHLLTLGTRNLIAVTQPEAFGTITMRVLV
jgi:meiotic recombination protein REC8, fungi type